MEGIKTQNGDVIPEGNDIEVNGTKYKGVGIVTHTVGYDNFAYAKTSREIGIVAAGLVPATYIMPFIWAGIKKVAFAVGNAIKGLFTSSAEAGEALQQTEIELQEAGEQEITEGAEVAVEEAAVDGAAIASGALFIWAYVVIATIFIALSFILHNSYHHVRIWNLTKYKMEWDYFFDHELFQEGQITSAPIDFKNKNPVPIPGATRGSHIPGVQGVPEVHYGEVDVVSSNELTGIGYVLKLYLKDPITDNTVYTVTTYYDIPFSGDNSTNLTFDDVTDPQDWFTHNSGDNKSTVARSGSWDGAISAVNTYDYLGGKHGVPSQIGGSSNEAFYYQSILCVTENDLKVGDLP